MWRNNHRRMNCRSTSCRQFSVEVTSAGRVLPCPQCQNVSASREFQNALNHKVPSNPKKMKHVNERFRNTLLAHQWADAKGLRELVESAVRLSISNNSNANAQWLLG